MADKGQGSHKELLECFQELASCYDMGTASVVDIKLAEDYLSRLLRLEEIPKDFFSENHQNYMQALALGNGRGKRKNSPEVTIGCEYCSSDAQAKCLICNEYFCKRCVKEHEIETREDKIKHSMEYIPPPIGSPRRNSCHTSGDSDSTVDGSPPSASTLFGNSLLQMPENNFDHASSLLFDTQESYCYVHSRSARYVCIGGRCRKLICNMCLVSNHQGHVYLPIGKFSTHCVNIIKGVLHFSILGEQKIKTKIDEVLRIQYRFERDCMELKQSIDRMQQQFTLLSDYVIDYHHEKIQSYRREKLNLIHDQMVQLKAILTSYSEITTKLHSLTLHSHRIDEILLTITYFNCEARLEQLSDNFRWVQPKQWCIFLSPPTLHNENKASVFCIELTEANREAVRLKHQEFLNYVALQQRSVVDISGQLLFPNAYTSSLLTNGANNWPTPPAASTSRGLDFPSPPYSGLSSPAVNGQTSSSLNLSSLSQDWPPLPSSSQALPSSSLVWPTSSNGLPSSSQAWPSSSNGLPSSSQAWPASSNGLPSSSQAWPSSPQGLPSLSQGLPSLSQAWPSSSQNLPSSSQAWPSSSQGLPSLSQALQAWSALSQAWPPLPSSSQTLPSSSNTWPPLSQAWPSASRAAPSSSQALPPSPLTLPSSSLALPSSSCALEFNASLLLPSASNNAFSLPIPSKKTTVVENRREPKLLGSFGREGKELGEICRPWGICSTIDGHIVVSDRRNHRVQVFNSEGRFLYAFGREGDGDGEFQLPAGVCVDRANRIIVVDKDNHRVQIFSSFGRFILKFGKVGKDHGYFQYPWGVTTNSKQQILVSDSRNHRVQKFSSSGVYMRSITFEFGITRPSPRGVGATAEGLFLVSDFDNHCLYVVDGDLEGISLTIGGEGISLYHFNRPSGISINADGFIAVADSKNQRILIFNNRFQAIKQIPVMPLLYPGVVECRDRISDLAFIARDRLAFVIELSPDTKVLDDPSKKFIHIIRLPQLPKQ